MALSRSNYSCWREASRIVKTKVNPRLNMENVELMLFNSFLYGLIYKFLFRHLQKSVYP